MNPQIVWNVWRRILREEPLQKELFESEEKSLDLFDLSDEEKVIALDYAGKSDRAIWFVQNYRFRLTNSFLNALEQGSPLVLRALINKGTDMVYLGERFLKLHTWKDYGPFVYTYCLDVLNFLVEDEVSAEPQGLRSLIKLEMTVINLLKGLIISETHPNIDDSFIYRTPYALTFFSHHKLSIWLRNKKEIGRNNLPKEVEHYLIYLPDMENSHKFTLMPSRPIEILKALHSPCGYDSLAQRLVSYGYAPSDIRDAEYLTLLSGYRAIVLPRS